MERQVPTSPRKKTQRGATVKDGDTYEKLENGAADTPEKVFTRQRDSSPGLALKATVLGLLLCQNTTYTLVRRYSQATLHEKYDPQEVLLAGEVFKLLFSIGMASCSDDASEREEQESSVSFVFAAFSCGRRGCERLTHLTKHSGKMFALALIYGVMNVLSYVAIRRVDAAVFTVCAQLKILTTAAASVIVLRKRISPTKWRALLQLVLGCVLVTVPQMSRSGGTAVDDSRGNAGFAVGVVAVIVEVSLSGLASIYFEKVVKGADTFSVWDRNFQLALHSIVLYLLGSFVQRTLNDDVLYRPLHDFSPVAWLLAFLGGGGGLLVALTVKVADSVVKTLAVSISIVSSTLASHFLLDGPLDLPMAIGALVVALAVLNYHYDASPQPILK